MNIIIRFLIAGLLVSPVLLIAQSPVPYFSANETAICGNVYSENFTDQSTYNPTSWKWYFPGATPDTSSLKNPTNILYNGYGCYNVKLVVRNKYGSDSLIKNNYICLDTPIHVTIKGSFEVCKGGQVCDTFIVNNGDSTFVLCFGVVTSRYALHLHRGPCSFDTSFAVYVDSMPTFVFKGNTSICQGQSTIIYAYNPRAYRYRYLWNTGATTDSLVTGPLYNSQNYYLTISKGACVKDSSEIAVNVRECTGVENYNNPLKEVKVYPNPSSGFFSLQFNSQQPTNNSRIEVYNVLGQQVYQTNIFSGNIKIELSNQPQGVYLYRIIMQTGDLVEEGKLIIQR